jgi:uncharacterized protein
MSHVALWRTLYTPGHDAALLFETGSGWRLEGNAVYRKEREPASISYALDLYSDWSTRMSSIDGFVGGRRINILIERDDEHWTLNGVPQDAVRGLRDLDLGFTPATNLPQLRRMGLSIGATQEIVVAWFDTDRQCLEPLPQIYHRVADRAYDYNSPRSSYHATLQIAADGFVSLYPGLWEMEGEHL